MARITDGILPTGFVPGLTLDRYQEIMRLPIAAFNGLNKPDEIPQYECSTIWNQSERDYVATYLGQAEEMREQELTYFISPKYIIEDYQYQNPLILNHKHAIKIGAYTTVDISLAEPIILSTMGVINDPIIITIATTLTDATEIKVFYPGEDVELHPSYVAITGGNIIIRIPRSRLVLPALNDNREDHLDYYDDANFLDTCDIKRCYYDEAHGVEYVWLGGCGCGTALSTEVTYSAYAKIDSARIAKVYTYAGIYSLGVWSAVCLPYPCDPMYTRIRYLSGRQQSVATEIQSVRLSHTLMPNKPASCPTVHQLFQEDVTVQDNSFWTPYGNRNGAIMAWMSDSRAKVGQGGKFPSMV